MATELGYARSHYNRIENGREPLTDSLKRTIELMEGEVELKRLQEQKSNLTPLRESAAESVRIEGKLRKVPIMSWAQAGEAVEFEEMPEGMRETIQTDCLDTGAIAVTIKGDSMAPDFPEGSVAIIMPHIYACPGKLVVARLKDKGVVFKRLAYDGGEEVELRSSNPKYPPIRIHRDNVLWMHPVYWVGSKVW